MDIPTDRDLLKQIEAFLVVHDMKPTRFGREAMGDGALLQHLRGGRSLSLKNANKVVDFMDTYSAAGASAAA